MKKLFGIFIFIIAGFSAAYLFGSSGLHFMKEVPFDDEQTGMKEQIIIRFSHVVSENTPKGLAAGRFADLVQKKSNNRVKVVVFPNAELFSDEGELNALQSGQVQMIAPSTSKLGTLSPEWLVLDLPYAFSSNEAVKEAYEGEIGEALFADLKKQNIEGLAFWYNGFKQMTTVKGTIIHPTDVKGQVFRIMPSKVIEKQYEVLEAASRPIPFDQTYHNLEKGTIDGEENTISNIYSKKYYHVQKYMTITNHAYLGYAVLMNREFWNGLPSEIQDIIREAMVEATDWNWQYSIDMNESNLQQLKENTSMQIYELTPEDETEWRNKLKKVDQHFSPIIGESMMERLQKIKNKFDGRSSSALPSAGVMGCLCPT
ncbi:DctP family TRAP transporter solute-binding subunit [Bacillus sp. JJ1532]|uniref:DctP family TRAP transporter solute-binding subunit n=1 Tax=unclassified Bacillus (in: firmicutes) TaxID=185979 RepID=UPI002FFF5C2B